MNNNTIISAAAIALMALLGMQGCARAGVAAFDADVVSGTGDIASVVS